MRARGLLLLTLLGASACTTTTTLTPAALAPLRAPAAGDAVVLDAPGGGKVRVDANSRIRFRLTDGRQTPWMPVRDLAPGEDGLFFRYRVPFGQLGALDGADLSPEDHARLLGWQGAEATADPDGVYLVGPAARAALRARAEAPEPLSGRWRTQLPSGAWTGWMDGETLRSALEAGLELESGVLWRDIADAEIKNFSGGKTLGLIIGGAAVIATIAALSKGGCCKGLAAATTETAVRGAYVGTVIAVHHQPVPARLPVRVSDARDPGVAQSDLQEPTSGATRLFTGAARRRADFEVVPSLQTMATLSAPEGLEQTGALSLRFSHAWELGGRGAGRRALGAGGGGPPRSASSASAEPACTYSWTPATAWRCPCRWTWGRGKASCSRPG
jgi:hypothetical protein